MEENDGCGETKLIVSEQDRPKAFLELDDETLGKFARQYLIQIEQAVERSAGNKEMPLSLATSMHGAIALYRIASKANAGELHLQHDAVEWGGEQHGDWELIVRRQPAIAIETGTATTRSRRGPRG